MIGVISRPLITGDSKCDKDLSQGLELKFCYAYLDKAGGFNVHDTSGTGTLKLGTTQANSGWSPGGGGSFPDDYKIHGQEMTVMWLCLAHVGIMAQRYLKWWKYSFYVHILMSYTVIGFTLGSVYHIYKKIREPYDTMNDRQRWHSCIGLTICSLVCAQALTGIVTKIWMMFKEDINVLRISRRVHQVLG